MPPVKPGKKPTTGGPGVKLLITATSLAATVGGWALIGAKETTMVQPVQPSAAAQVAAPPAATARFSIKLAPLPTLVPELANQAQLIPVNNAQVVASAPQTTVSRLAPQVAAQPAPQPALVLRDVSAPAVSSGGGGSTSSSSAPAPVTNTHSSK